jgi:hypothetical protein
MRLATCKLAAVCVLMGAFLAGVPAAADAASAPIASIADQKPGTFEDPRFRSFKMKRTRVVVPWNVAYVSHKRAYLRDYLRRARRAGIREVMVAFNHSLGDRCPARPCRAPSVRSYQRAFRKFRRQFRSVRVIQPWNEANSPTQPTGNWRRGAKKAAQYYNVVRRFCRGCKVTAADVLDLSKRTMTRWLRTFKRYAKGSPRLWGLHNYTDTNGRSGLTRTFLRLVRGEVWITETGGIVRFQLQSGKTRYRYSEGRAARATTNAFRIASRYRSRIRRLYLYQWSIDTMGNRFDAGLVRANSSPRAGYYRAKKYRRWFR